MSSIRCTCSIRCWLSSPLSINCRYRLGRLRFRRAAIRASSRSRSCGTSCAFHWTLLTRLRPKPKLDLQVLKGLILRSSTVTFSTDGSSSPHLAQGSCPHPCTGATSLQTVARVGRAVRHCESQTVGVVAFDLVACRTNAPIGNASGKAWLSAQKRKEGDEGPPTTATMAVRPDHSIPYPRRTPLGVTRSPYNASPKVRACNGKCAATAVFIGKVAA